MGDTPRIVTLVVEGTYPAHIGGISTWVDSLIRACPDTLFEVIRIGPLPPRDTWAFSIPENVTSVVAVDAPTDLVRTPPEGWARSVAEHLPRPDLVHTAGTGLAGALGLAFKRRGASLIVTEHASYVEELRLGTLLLESGQRVPPAQRDAYIQLFATLRDACYAQADLLTSLFEQRRQLQVMYGAASPKTLTIPNGVRAPALRTAGAVRPMTLGFVGRIATIKDPLAFIDVVESAATERPGLRGIMFGPIDCDAAYARRFRDRVEASASVDWRGAVPADEAFSQIDVLVLPSQSEAQPLAVLEAMARAIPVITTPVGDVRRMIEHPQHGRRAGIVAASPETMVEPILQLADHAALRRRLGAHGRDRVRRFYSMDATASAYQRAYASFGLESGRGFACAS